MVIIDKSVVAEMTSVAYSVSVLYKLDRTTVCIMAGSEAMMTKTLYMSSGIGKICAKMNMLSGAMMKRPIQMPERLRSKRIFFSPME